MHRVRLSAALLCLLLCLGACAAAPAKTDGETPSPGETGEPSASETPSPYQIDEAIREAMRPLEPAGFRYGREFLKGDALALYDALWSAADRLEPGASVTVPASLSGEELDRVLSYLLDDNPRFYWANPQAGEDENGSRSVVLVSQLDAAELARREAALFEAAALLLQDLRGDRAQAVYEIHDRLIEALAYEREGAHPDVGNLYGGLVEGSVICDGFAQTFQFLCDQAGLEAVTLRGSSHRGVSHAWNAVRIDGAWYYVDLTWDKAASLDGAVSRQYLCITHDEMASQHLWLDTQYPALPAADATDACYYLRAGGAVEGQAPDSRGELSDAFAARLAAQLAGEMAGSGEREVYLEIKLLCGEEDYRQFKALFIKSLYEILADLADEAAASGRPYAVRTGGEIRCDYNDAVQVLILYPRVDIQADHP